MSYDKRKQSLLEERKLIIEDYCRVKNSAYYEFNEPKVIDKLLNTMLKKIGILSVNLFYCSRIKETGKTSLMLNEINKEEIDHIIEEFSTDHYY